MRTVFHCDSCGNTFAPADPDVPQNAQGYIFCGPCRAAAARLSAERDYNRSLRERAIRSEPYRADPFERD